VTPASYLTVLVDQQHSAVRSLGRLRFHSSSQSSRTSGLRYQLRLVRNDGVTSYTRTPALSCHITKRIKPNEENLGSHSADKNTVFSNVTSFRNLHRIRRNLPLPSSGQVSVSRLRLQGRQKSRLTSDHRHYISENSAGKCLTRGIFWINMLRSANEG
jgi:hypothetical protein